MEPIGLMCVIYTTCRLGIGRKGNKWRKYLRHPKKYLVSYLCLT